MSLKATEERLRLDNPPPQSPDNGGGGDYW